jgi:hypothetical protein
MEKLTLLMVFLVCLSCAGGKASRPVPPGETVMTPVRADDPDRGGRGSFPWFGKTLEEFTELERSGAYTGGMGIAESVLREDAGDYAGAALAAYKELSWMYSHGLITKETVETGLKNVVILKTGEQERGAVLTAQGLLAFVGGRWEEAEQTLAPLFGGDDEPDSFARWLLLICALEKEPADRSAGAAYGAIRARYSSFPEYWYRGARVFSGRIAGDYAERCINLAPAGPFAGECRGILAVSLGLDPQDGASLKSLAEIDNLLARAVAGGSPELLSGLLPLISLPDNPYTVYAAGALRTLAELPKFRNYFEEAARKSSGRLAERLTYICGGQR